jgi:ketosteroid isomerase-like protein
MKILRAKSCRSRIGLAIVALVGGGRIGLADSAEDWRRMRGITPKGYVCYQADTPPQMDGRLDDVAWQAVPWTDDFVDIEGDARPRPRFRTRAKMLWDAHYFYLGVEMQEPHVWGTLTQHDSIIFHDNDLELFVDPDGDNHEYAEIEMNALNTTWDLFLPRPYKDGGRARDDWEARGLLTAVHVDGTLNDPSDEDRGWSIEMAVPWQAVRDVARRPAPPRDGDQWRVNLSRVEWQHVVEKGAYRRAPKTREDNWVWSPQGIIDMHRPERWGCVQFSTSAPGTVQYHPDPARSGRDALLEIYHHQHAYRQRHGRWAERLEQLGLDPARRPELPRPPRLSLTAAGFRAFADVPLAGNQSQEWSIRHDSRLRPARPGDAPTDELEVIIEQQAAAWNAGDLDEFMRPYWKSEDLSFSSAGQTTRGWEATLRGYRERYPTRDRMGQLSFRGLDVSALGDSTALVLGTWQLDRDPDPVGGNFSLMLARKDGEWVIVHDHTSRETPAVMPNPLPVSVALERAGDNRRQIHQALSDVPASQRAAMEFLVVNMPDRDLRTLSAEFLLENVRLAYQAWNDAPWKAVVPMDVFFNNVLPYANINERRDRWRQDFYERFQPLVRQAKSPAEAAAILNQEIFARLKVRYSTEHRKADQSPHESIETGLASCSGLAVLLIDACRAVGIPARFVGTPLWTDNSGNHSWVEIWDQGWHFTGAAEPSGRQLDQAWFVEQAAAARRDDPRHAIYAASFRRTPLKFPLAWDPAVDSVSAVDVTDFYARRSEPIPEGTVPMLFRAVARPGGNRLAATLRVTDADGRIVFDGRTRDESFDPHDHQIVYLRTGAPYRAEARFEKRRVVASFLAVRRVSPLTLDFSTAQSEPGAETKSSRTGR